MELLGGTGQFLGAGKGGADPEESVNRVCGSGRGVAIGIKP